MTLDFHPERWRRIARLYLELRDLPDDEAERLIDALPEVEQDRLTAFLLMTNHKPKKALRELEAAVKSVDIDYAVALINKLPRPELEKLAKARLNKKGKLIAKLSKMKVDELQHLVLTCSLPRDLLAHIVFTEGLDPKRQKSLLS